MEPNKSKKIGVALFILLGFVLLTVAIFVIGSKENPMVIENAGNIEENQEALLKTLMKSGRASIKEEDNPYQQGMVEWYILQSD